MNPKRMYVTRLQDISNILNEAQETLGEAKPIPADRARLNRVFDCLHQCDTLLVTLMDGLEDAK